MSENCLIFSLTSPWWVPEVLHCILKKIMSMIHDLLLFLASLVHCLYIRNEKKMHVGGTHEFVLLAWFSLFIIITLMILKCWIWLHVLFSSVDSMFQKTGLIRKFGHCLKNLMFVQEFQISCGPHLTHRFSLIDHTTLLLLFHKLRVLFFLCSGPYGFLVNWKQFQSW